MSGSLSWCICYNEIINILKLKGTLCLSSNVTKYESIAPQQDYVESRTIAHMRDNEKLFFVYFSFWEAAL